eukprot:g6044.t1
MFEAEITPNLRDVDFFPITHRFHGEQIGLTEDVFIAATLKLNAVCLGGIDAQLSEVSSDAEESDDDNGDMILSMRASTGPNHEPVRGSEVDHDPSALDAQACDASVDEDLPITMTAAVEAPRGGEGQVEIGGNFDEWDLQVFPPLQSFVKRTKRAQLQVLKALARVPCLLEHSEVKPFQAMVGGYGLGFDLPQGGNDALEGRNNSAPWGKEGGTFSETTDKMKEMEEDVDVFLQECDWLASLSEDPYYRGLQDKVFLSLASSHNAVYRMLGGLRPLLEDLKEEASRYRYYNQLVDQDMVSTGGKGSAKPHFDEERMRLDLERVDTHRKQLVLKWAAHRTVCVIREEWDSSKLISSNVEVMTGQLAQATRKHILAVTTAGADEVTDSCKATLAHLGRVLEAVGFLHNRNLTGVYWERVERIIPLREDLKAAARNESMTSLRSAAGLEVLPAVQDTATAPSQLESELERVWETAPMMFVWRFNEGPPAPGNIKQELHVDPDSKQRRKQYSRVLAEPALVTRGYIAGGIDGSLGGAGDGQEGEASQPPSEGYTSLLSNGDELLRLAEHCRVVVDSVVDAPSTLLATGNTGKAALEWQKRISWFQELLTNWMAVQEQWVRLVPAFVTADPDVGPAHERVRFTDVSRWLSSCIAVCPRLLALPRHQLFRLFRDWAAGRVASGAAAGETNERVAYMFRGAGEIIWKEIVTTTGGSTVRKLMAAAGVRSSGAGLEVVSFSSPVLVVGRFEMWVRDVDRQLMSTIAHGVDMATTALRQYGKAEGASQPSALLHAGPSGGIVGGNRKISTSVQPRPEATLSSNGAPAGERSQPSLQARLLARSAHWTTAVEAALTGSGLIASKSQPGGGSSTNSYGGEIGDTRNNTETMLQEILSSILLHIKSLAEELSPPGGMPAYESVATTALTTLALQHRDVLEELLKPTSSDVSAIGGSTEQFKTFTTASTAVADSPLSSPAQSPATKSFRKGGESTNFAESAAFSPFLWTCHLRHYFTPPEEALPHKGRADPGGGNSKRGEGQEQEPPPPPPPLIRIGIGPWNIPYGFEYAGTLERLWLTPLAERSLLHAVHSAKAVSSAIASTLMAGGVTVFAGVEELPKVSLAVLSESLRAVLICLHAQQEEVVVNGEKVPLSPRPHLSSNFDPILHQWKLLPWGSNNGDGGGGGPFLGFFATLAKQGPAPQLPLAIRFAFRPVVTALPNMALILEASLLTNGFIGARALVQGLVHGLRELRDNTTAGGVHDEGEANLAGSNRNADAETVPTAMAVAPGVPPVRVDNNACFRNDSKTWASVDATTLMHTVAAKAVRTAAELLGPETARELRAARRKLGLASLTSSERKEKTRHLSRAVEARVLIAGFTRALLFEETGGDVRALKSKKTKKSTPSSSSNTSPARAVPNGAFTATDGDQPKDADQLEIDARRALIVSTFQQTTIFREILKPLEDMAIDAASDLWQALWSCSRPAVIITGAAGVGKSAILQAMPKMAEHVNLLNRKLNKSLQKLIPPAKKTDQNKADQHDAEGKGNRKPDVGTQHPSASPLDPPGAVFEPPSNQRGAAPFRRIVNRQAWLKKLARQKFQYPGAAEGIFRPILLATVSDFFRQEGFIEIMGKGIPEIVAGQSRYSEGSHAADGADDAISKEEGESKTEVMVDRRIHLLDRARRRMADAGAKVAKACSEARSATEPDAARCADIAGMAVQEENDDPPGLVSQAIKGSTAAADKPGSNGGLGGPSRPPDTSISYLEICSKTDDGVRRDGARQESTKTRITGGNRPARTMVAHGVLMNVREVFSPGSITELFARAIGMLNVPWPAKPDARPLVTPQDVNNTCKTLRWSCWTRGGIDFVYRRIVSYVRQSLTVALCLDDDEVINLSPSFPALSTCPSVRLEAWSGRSMRLAASRSLSAHLNRCREDATADTATRDKVVATCAEERLAAGGSGSASKAKTCIPEDERRELPFDVPGKGGLCLWPGATHAHLIGVLAFGRFQSTVTAFADPQTNSASSSLEGDGGQAIELIKQDARRAVENSARLYDAWMILVEPSCCVEVFQVVEACAGGDGGLNGEGSSVHHQGQSSWGALKARCFRAMSEEGRGPRAASLDDVLQLFKYLCRLGCRRIVERAQTLRRALDAAAIWGVPKANREVQKVQLKKRAKDVQDALDDNNEHMKRIQQEKTKMEFLCTLCLGAGVVSSAGGSSHVAEAMQQRKQKGLHPELPFIVETVAVMLGNMSDYSQWVGEWVRLKASPSAKIIRALLLDPAIADRLIDFNPESEAGREAAKVVIEKITERAAEASKKEIGDAFAASKDVPVKEGGGYGGAGGDDIAGSSADTPAAQFVKRMPLLPLKLESRAIGLLAAWVRDTVVLIDALTRAEEIRATILSDAKATRVEEERIRVGNADEMRPLDDELALRATFKSRLSARQRAIHHRNDLIKELGFMGGTIEDFADTCRQELHDLAAAAEFFAGDALCLSNLTCLAAHLPYTIRTIALNRARNALQKHGVPVSQPCTVGDEGTSEGGRRVSTSCNDDGSDSTQTDPDISSATGALALERYRVGDYCAGVLANLMQFQSWACPTDPAFDEDDSGDESDGGREWSSGAGEGLPFHPAFMDAALLALSTPKWPLLLDPEGVALRWLRLVYGDQSRLDNPLPACMVSMDVIAEYAGKGEVLPVCFTEGGVHSDLVLFLGKDVHPIGAGHDKGATKYQADGCKGSSVADTEDGTGPDGFVMVGVDPQSSTVIVLKPGFRLIFFENSSFATSSSCSPCSPSSLVFLRDSPEALARIQLVRFGGVDCVGVMASDHGDSCLRSTDCETGRVLDGNLESTVNRDWPASLSDTGSSHSDSSSSTESTEPQDAPLPTYVLAGMGLIRQPGFEMSKTMGARLQEEFARAVALGSGVDALKNQQTREAATSVAAAQRGALAYSRELSATHEAVIALLAARPPCFNTEGPRCAPDVTVPSGGEPTTGVSDEVERDQNRVLNNLIETFFVYKGILEKGVDIVPKCGRASQARHAITAHRADEMGHIVTSSALRLLARSGDMLHVWRLDPVLYSPVFPGVRTLVQDAVRRAADAIESHKQHGLQALERAVVVSLTRSMVTRVPDDHKWVLLLAALAVTSPDDFPDNGWWDTCVALAGDRQGKVDETGGSSSRLCLAKLFKMVVSAGVRAGGGLANEKAKPVSISGDDKQGLDACTEGNPRNQAANPGLAQVRGLVGSWRVFDEGDVPNFAEVSGADHDCYRDDSDGDDDAGAHRQRVKLFRRNWDLGFDISGWAGDGGAAAVAAIARDRGIRMDTKAGDEDTNTPGGDESRNNAFFSSLAQLWSTAESDRAAMNAIQAAEATEFSRDDVLRRLVLMETTMNSVFARLPGYVMCEARRWNEWMSDVCCSLSAAHEEGSGSTATAWLRFLLSHPPPAFESKINMENDDSSMASSPSSSDEDGDSSHGSSSSNNSNNSNNSSNSGSSSGQDGDKEKSAASSPDALYLATGIGPLAGEVKPLEALPTRNKVRRDSRERMKIKFGLLHEPGISVGARERENDSSEETKEVFNARARSLFGISTSRTRGVSSAKKLPPSDATAPGAANTEDFSRSFHDAAKTRTTASDSSRNINMGREDNAGERDEHKFITFVAESFRPQRDNSDWHREAKPHTVPPSAFADTTVTSTASVVDQEPTEPPVAASTSVANTPVVRNETAAARDDEVDKGQHPGTPPTSSPQNLPDGPLSDSDSSSETLLEHSVIESACTGQKLNTPTGTSKKLKDRSRVKSTQGATNRRNDRRSARRAENEHAAVLKNLWAHGSVARGNERPDDEQNDLAAIAFGTDEFAGDREVACFLASGVAASAASAAAAEAAAWLPAGGMAKPQTLERPSMLPAERVDRLKQNVATGIAALDPVCSSAVQEVVVQLGRLQSLRLLTATKGVTATYSLDDFFGEQTRNIVECQRELIDVYDRCGQILGRAAKKHLEAEGLLVTNRAWNQVTALLKFCSRISLPDNCLSASRAIQLACELVPHAEETLAFTNPLGAKPVLIEMFEAEITPSLRGVDFFPITHRLHGEHAGLTEDVFIAAMMNLSAVCVGGIDAQLSEVSSDREESDDENGDATLAVEIGGNFDEWDLQVVPPLQNFVERTKRAQLQVLKAVARVPCLLEHPEVKPFHAMVEGYGLGFDLPQGGNDEVLAGRSNSAPCDWEEGGTSPEITDKMKEMEEGVDVFLQECDWIDNLSEDPYYRGLQDKVFLSLASSHNAVYRMVDGLRPLLEDFQALGAFAAQKDARIERLQRMLDPDVIAAKLIASGRQNGSGGGSLDLTPPSKQMMAAAFTPPETSGTGDNENHTITRDLAGPPQSVTFEACLTGLDLGDDADGVLIDVRQVEDQALESLAREIDRLEADILDPALFSAATDPVKACSRLEAYGHRLTDLEEEASRYRYYNQLVDQDVATAGGKCSAKPPFDEERMRLDLERVDTQRKQLVLKWAAQRRACAIREEWDNSKLICSNVEVMAGQLARATRKHIFAITTAGADEVTSSCEATLAHLGRVVEAVGFLQNRNLTGAYWERVEQTIPLSEDLKAAARNESTTALRRAAGLEAMPDATQQETTVTPSPLESEQQSTTTKGDIIAVPREFAADREAMKGEDDETVACRVASGAAAGETNERFAYMFRGVGEIIWKEIVSTTGETTVRTHMAAAGVRSSGAGLEVVPFSSPVVVVGRFEMWVRDIDRQLMSTIAHDVEIATTALRQHGKTGGAPQPSTLLHAGARGTNAAGNRKISTSGQPKPEAMLSSNQPHTGERSQPSLQARLLARSAHWTTAVEAALTGSALATSHLETGGGDRPSYEGKISEARNNRETVLQRILSSILLRVNSLAEELCQSGGIPAYDVVATTALTTQALQHRDVLEELLKATSSAVSVIQGSAGQPETSGTASTAVANAPLSSPAQSPATTSFSKEGESTKFTDAAAFSPFLWTCHLRHYFTPPEEALPPKGRAPSGGKNSERGEGQEQKLVPPPPPPLIRVGIGPWNIPYGFEYAASDNHRRLHVEGIGVPASSFPSPADISTVAHDVAVTFGRPFRLLNSGCVTSPQAVSSVIASTLMAGGVAVFTGVEELPKVSLAVLSESLRAVLLCLHARQEEVVVNGEEIDAASELWQALWSCSRPAVIITGAAGVGKSAILQTMPKMAEHVDVLNRKLNRSLQKLAPPAKKTDQNKADEHDANRKGSRKPDSAAQHPSASPLDPPGAVFEPPANQRGAAPYRRIVNRQVPFLTYVNATASFRRPAKKSYDDGGTVASSNSGSSKGTKATNISDASNVSVGESAVADPSLVASVDFPPDESTAANTKRGQPLLPSVIARQNEVALAEVKEIEKRLRVTAFLLCVYASIWGMGGHLVGEASRINCSAYIRQFASLELRQHIRESNLFNFVVDIRGATLLPIGDNAVTSTAVYKLLGMNDARVMVEGPSGVGKTALLSHLLKDVFSPGAITEHFARAIGMLNVPWPARPDARPLVTPQDVNNICKTLRWSCWTRGGIDFVYRRIVSYVRQSLTVALCLDDDEEEELAAGEMGSASKAKTCVPGDERPELRLDMSGKGGVYLWPGATHAHLIGALAFGRFQSTVTAFVDAPINAASSSLEGDGRQAIELIKKDARRAIEDSARLYDAWMILAEPSYCVEVFQTVEACAGGADELNGRGTSVHHQGQPWRAIKAMCFRAMSKEGRDPRAASMDDVLQLFKHLCRLGCRRIVERAQTLRRALDAVDLWGVHKAHREVEQVQLKKRAKDVQDALDNNYEQMERVQQEKTKETVAVMLGNMSGYSRWVGEWVRLKASPSAKIIRALLLDPAIVDRLNSFNPESKAGRGAAKIVFDKIAERAAEASQKKISDAFATSKGLPTGEDCGYGDLGGDEVADPAADTPAAQFAKQMPLLTLKLESRAIGLLAAWVRDTVALVEGLTRAEEIRAEILADAKATRLEEERIRVGNADEVRPLDEELAQRVSFKSRLSTRQRTIHHRTDLIKELGIMGGAIEDFADTCRQELHDIAATAEFFAGDALCFSNVACLAAHLPYTLRAIALNRARNALQKRGVPVSQPSVVSEEGTSECGVPVSTPCDDNDPHNARTGSDVTQTTGALALKRFRFGDFLTGVLTNLMQLQSWAFPTDTAVAADDSEDESDGGGGWSSCAGDGLPFHPAFMDAAMLVLCTPKWPLLLDPEGIALRWLRHVYPGQSRLDALLPACAVSIDVIAECAKKGEVLPVCFTEGGVHRDLVLFLGTDVHPIGAGGDKAPTICPEDGKKGSNEAYPNVAAGSEGFVVVGLDPQSSTTIVLKPGFRVILFESSSSATSSSCTPSPLPSLVFLRDSPEALARVQLVRFGGVDCVGVTTSDHGVSCLLSTDCEMGRVSHGSEESTEDDDTSATSSDEETSSSETREARDTPLPAYVLAGMGLIRQPGFEMSKTMGARLQEEFARAVALGSGVDALENQQTSEAATSVVGAQRGALAYSRELSATHEAVIALLAARPPCFNTERPPCAPDMTVPPGGEPTMGGNDEVERDQNRILNNLIETLFAYKGVLETGVDILPKCGRACQAKHAVTARQADKVSHALTSSAFRFLARSGDMLHVWGLDPVFYSPVFPGVRTLVQGAVRRAADGIGSQRQEGQQAFERAVVVSLTRSMVTRVPDSCKWIPPLAALTLTSPGDLPADGWWDTCVALVGERHVKVDEPGGSSRPLSLTKLFKMVTSADTQARGRLEKEKPKQEPGCSNDKEGLEACTEQTPENKAAKRGLAQVRELAGSWLKFDEPEVPTVTDVSGTGHDCADDDSEDDDDPEISRQRVKLSPQKWDLGFDTSGWASDRGATAVAALARDRGIPIGVKTGVADTNRLGGDDSGNDKFFPTLSQLWSTATSDRAMMNDAQAVEAKAFSCDDVLRRLVLMETTMNRIFSRLPGYVMCEAKRWSEWTAEVSRSLSAVEERGDSTTIGWLRYLLSHPPPTFESKANRRHSSSTSSSSSSSDEDRASSEGSARSSSSSSGTDEDSDEEQPTNSNPGTRSLATAVGPQETPPLHNKVRRDSRERIKIKLGLLDELGMAVGAEEKRNHVSAESKEEFYARARRLFGISTSQFRGVSSAKKLHSSIASTVCAAANTKERSRFGPSDKAAKTTMIPQKSSASVGIDEEDDVDEEDGKFITFVAESFRPRRDDSNWHREAIPDPVPPAVSPMDNTSNTPPAVADQGPKHLHVPITATSVTDKPVAAGKDNTVMVPANGGFADATSRHFASVLSHIERAAQEAGTSVTVHDASKPAHVLLGRGVLVAPALARRMQKGHATERAGSRHPAGSANGGPANANMAQSTWEVCLKAAADGGWVVIQDFEGAADCISLIIDGIRRRSAVRTASIAAAERQEKLLREQQIAGKQTTTATMQSSGDGSIISSPARPRMLSSGAALASQQVGGAGATTVAPAAARNGSVTRRAAILGVSRRKKASEAKRSPEHPLFKSLSAGEGGTMSTRAQPVAAVALRRPLPEPHKNFRIILLSTAPPENRAQDTGRSFGIAFATDAKDELVDFAWLDDERADSAGEEAARALDDLLRLESVFGDTEVDTTSSSCKHASSVDIYDGPRYDKTARCVEDVLEVEDTEGLLRLFDDDLQDAMLALPDGELDSRSEKDEEGCGFGASAFCKAVDCGESEHDTVSDNTSVDCCSGSDTAVDCSVLVDCDAQSLPAAPRGEEMVVSLKTADVTGEGLVKAAGQCNSSSGGGRGERTEVDDGRVTPEAFVSEEKVAVPADAAATTAAGAGAADSADVVSAPGVPTRLLDAIDLWESANAHAKTRKKAAAKAARQREAAAAAAAARGGGGGRRGAVTTRSKAKKIGKPTTNVGGDSSGDVTKKKKNEFGKRRRSSGGGGATAPILDAAAAAASAPAAATPAKATKGKGKGKKVDPLVAIRDARSLSRKPLIVQWLKSDGCDSDAEAEAALGKAVGSLSAISRYWGGGG